MPLKDDWAPNDTILSAMANAHAEALNDLLARVATLEGGGGGGGGAELAYAERTSALTVSATDEATPNTIVTAPQVTLSTTTIIQVEFFAPSAGPGATSGHQMYVNLWEDSTNLGWSSGQATPAAGGLRVPIRVSRRLTKTAGAYTYSARAWRWGSDGLIQGGVGGAGAFIPMFIRVSEA
jgi:hypothetical protein